MANKIEINVNKISAALRGLSPKIVAEIVAGIGGSTDPKVVSKVVTEVFKKFAVKDKITTSMLSGLSGAMSAGAKRKIPVASVKRWFTEYAYSPDVKLFKKSINDMARTGEIVDTVRRGMAKGNSWRKIAQDMRDKNIQVGDVAKDVQSLIDGARQSYTLTGDVRGFRAYEKEIKAVKKRIEKLVDPSTSKLKAAYSEIVSITDGASAEAVERAAKYAIYHKQKYNAEKIARSELARAYDQAFQTELADDEDAIGWRSILSSNHTIYDVCNLHAEADLYGMGPGVYPKNHGPEIPYHPQCVCMAEPIYEGETKAAKPKDFDKNGGVNYIANLPEDKRIELLGVKGSEAFERNPKAWAHQVKSYGGQKSKPKTVPIEVLHGEDKTVKAKALQ